MEDTPSRVIDFWEAFDSVEPLGEQWMQTAQISHLLDRIFACHSNSTKIYPVEDYMPPRYTKPPAVVQTKKVQRVTDMKAVLSSFMKKG